MARKSISKKLRFDIFKRDGFTCQYCGRMAPDVVLNIDHINPVKHGGDNDILNLITSCFDCNNGKGSKKLTDIQELKNQQKQLKTLSERKEQLEFMVEWRKELLKISETEIDVVESEIKKFNDKFVLSDFGRQSAKDLINKFTLSCVIEAVEIAFTTYDYEKTSESWNNAFSKVGGICKNNQIEKTDPTFSFRQRAYFTFKKNFHIHNEARLRSEIKRIVKDEKTLHDFYEIIDSSHTWTQFYENSELYGE